MNSNKKKQLLDIQQPIMMLLITIADNINATIISLYLVLRTLIPNTKTQNVFNDSKKNNFKKSFDSCTIDWKVVNNHLGYQVDIRSAANINSPKYSIVAHQTAARAAGGGAQNNAIFDNLDVRKYFVETDGVRYPKDAVDIAYTVNNYSDQYGDIEFFYIEYVGEPLL